MKRIILTIAILAMAANAFAAATVYPGVGGTAAAPPAGITFMPSKNVNLGYTPSAGTGGVDMIVYAIASKNNAGDRIFGATSASSAVAQSVSAAGTVLTTSHTPSVPSTISDSTITGGANNWSIL